jgi:hypothetical protein
MLSLPDALQGRTLYTAVPSTSLKKEKKVFKPASAKMSGNEGRSANER